MIASRVDCRAVRVREEGLLSYVYHLFIIFVGADGIDYYFRGGPTGDNPNFGNIVCHYGVYHPPCFDYDLHALSKTVMVSPPAPTFQLLKHNCERINLLGISYDPTGPNSNTVAKTLMLRSWMPARCPDWIITPGWDDPIL